MPSQDEMTSKANMTTASMTTADTGSAATPHHAVLPPSSSGDRDLKKGFDAREKLRKPLKFHLAFLSILLMVLIVSIDATALAVVIPTIAEEFDGTYLEAFWANASFLLVVTVVLPVYTGLSEVIGRKIPLYAAFFLFTAGSVLFATAQSLPVVILARALQGSGCGGIDVLNEILVADMTTLRERAFYIGLVSIPLALGSVLGPVVGALLGEYASWRWIGWMNLPLVALCLPLSIFCLTLKSLEGGLLQQLAGFDWCGLALFVVGAVSLTLPLSWAGAMYPGDSSRTLLPLAVSAAAFSNQFSSAVATLSDMPPALHLLLQENQALGSIPRLKELDLSPAELVHVLSAYQQSFRVVFFVLTGLSCLGFLLTLVACDATIESDEAGKQHLIIWACLQLHGRRR
ncbi:hypothetical protein MY3296_010192 [Beauveria thailandica]